MCAPAVNTQFCTPPQEHCARLPARQRCAQQKSGDAPWRCRSLDDVMGLSSACPGSLAPWHIRSRLIRGLRICWSFSCDRRLAPSALSGDIRSWAGRRAPIAATDGESTTRLGTASWNHTRLQNRFPDEACCRRRSGGQTRGFAARRPYGRSDYSPPLRRSWGTPDRHCLPQAGLVILKVVDPLVVQRVGRH